MDTNKMWEDQEKYLLRIPEALIPFSPAQYGERLRMLRSQKGYSLRAVAAALGCTLQNVQKIESGKNKTISRKLLPRFAKLYGCSCAYLMGYFEEDMKAVTDKEGKKLTSQSNILYYGTPYSFPVLRYGPDQILDFAAAIQACKRDPDLFLYWLKLSKMSPEKRRIVRKKLEELLKSKD